MERTVFPKEIERDSILYVTLLSLFEMGDKIFGAIYIAFMRIRGVSVSGISMLFGIEQILMAVLDLPTGAISDRIGRKKIASLGFIIWGIGIQLFCIGHGFFSFLPGICLFSLGMALISGAPGSWLIEQMIRKGVYERRGEVIPKASTIIRFFSIIAAVIAYFLTSNSNELTILVAGGISIVAGIAGLLLGEDNYGTVDDAKIHKIIKNSVKQFIKSKCLILLALKTVVGYVSFVAFVLYWQIYATEHIKIKTRYLSILLVLFMIMMMLGNHFVTRLSKKFASYKVVIIGYLVCFLGYLFLSINIENLLIVFLVGSLIVELGLGIGQSATFIWMNEYYDRNVRSTYSSIFSTIECGFGFLIINGLGFVAENMTVTAVWIIALVSIIVTIAIVKWIRKESDKLGQVA